MKREFRCDFGQFRKPTLTDQGYLKADGLATRVGIFNYLMPDGSFRRELKAPEEVFNDEAFSTLSGVPITNDHPPVMLDATNTRGYSVGFSDNAVDRDGDYVKVGLTITDAATINQMLEEGKVELSAGYFTQVDETPGIFNGEKYDAVQRNIRYNHIAIVEMGRAGPEAKVRLNDKSIKIGMQVAKTDEISVERKADEKEKEQNSMEKTKVQIDKVEYQVSEEAAQAIKVKLDSLEAKAKELETLKGKFDALEADLLKKEEEIKAVRDSAPSMEEMRASVKARMDLEGFASKYVGEDVKLDGMKDVEVKKAVIAKVYPKKDMAEKSDEYVDGCFSLIFDAASKEQKKDSLKESLANNALDAATPEYTSEQAREKMRLNSINQWKSDKTSA